MSNALMSKPVVEAAPDKEEKKEAAEVKQYLMKVDQQAKFLHLQAEIESLWQQVQRASIDN
ncbi:hypothetical protein FRE64_05855 [Euhalothece natronophila Z-M001]|uniref:Uncharacterized protein n=1 Tax=Euhalothece natronophila Z-M001 TaxID=522448 RepID=A0A5B8NMZ0_9CHRO|nr:hypothetical protein [Euhalothece natronophila]QDZ39489.1 hypothetical protein FRE64_05855 [Euhalothece natronophila Z-M001]